MSGVYFIVSNFSDENVRNTLKATKGGYPHVTLCYTGKKITQASLVDIGSVCIQTICMKKLILNAENAFVNSFFEEKTQKMRHDILIKLGEHDTKFIEHLRELVIPSEIKEYFTMREPHVTHSIHYDLETAQNSLEELRDKLPLTVYITGFTID